MYHLELGYYSVRFGNLKCNHCRTADEMSIADTAITCGFVKDNCSRTLSIFADMHEMARQTYSAESIFAQPTRDVVTK